jgi:hypothetical protein
MMYSSISTWVLNNLHALKDMCMNSATVEAMNIMIDVYISVERPFAITMP